MTNLAERLVTLDAGAARSAASRLRRLTSSPWKTLYPLILRRLGLSHRVAAETFWGRRMDVVLPESVSNHVWRFGVFEIDVCFFLLATLEPGMVFADIGAHFGFFTLLASDLTGPQGEVLALEPMPLAFAQLQRNVSTLAHADRVHLVNCAAFSVTTQLAFQDFGLVHAALNSAFGPRRYAARGRPVRTVPVEARPFDSIASDLRLTKVDVIKIDAESAEMHVLQGMERVIEQHRPKIILEVGDFDLPGVACSAELIRWLRARGYAPYQHAHGQLVPHILQERYLCGNLLFIGQSERR